MTTNKKTTQRQGFKTNEFIVYPAHGVGQILAIEEQEVAGAKLELFVINFVKDKMTLRVPTAKIVSVGMRKLAEPPVVKRALETLKGRARIKRTMWSRRAQEYEAKINSGDIVAIAEVVRDLYRSDTQPEQSYSERQLYEAALDRLSREIAAVQRVTETEAIKEIEAALAKGPRRGPKPAEEAGSRNRHRGRGGLTHVRIHVRNRKARQRCRAFCVTGHGRVCLLGPVRLVCRSTTHSRKIDGVSDDRHSRLCRADRRNRCARRAFARPVRAGGSRRHRRAGLLRQFRPRR